MFDISFGFQEKPYTFLVQEATLPASDSEFKVIYRIFDPSATHFLFSMYPQSGSTEGNIEWQLHDKGPADPIKELVQAVGLAIQRRTS